jgi:hypothetical protein
VTSRCWPAVAGYLYLHDNTQASDNTKANHSSPENMGSAAIDKEGFHTLESKRHLKFPNDLVSRIVATAHAINGHASSGFALRVGQLRHCSMKVSYSRRLSCRVSNAKPVHKVISMATAKPYPYSAAPKYCVMAVSTILSITACAQSSSTMRR